MATFHLENSYEALHISGRALLGLAWEAAEKKGILSDHKLKEFMGFGFCFYYMKLLATNKASPKGPFKDDSPFPKMGHVLHVSIPCRVNCPFLVFHLMIQFI